MEPTPLGPATSTSDCRSAASQAASNRAESREHYYATAHPRCGICAAVFSISGRRFFHLLADRIYHHQLFARQPTWASSSGPCRRFCQVYFYPDLNAYEYLYEYTYGDCDLYLDLYLNLNADPLRDCHRDSHGYAHRHPHTDRDSVTDLHADQYGHSLLCPNANLDCAALYPECAHFDVGGWQHWTLDRS